ncbi:MAG TPA: Tm-1-like ATP-binding domain-containing protein, partial [Planctomycetia bacterium]|nr:Tm-1-like ATP-binding domain-containing protein [Planctomycetia bacterium]
GVLTAGPLRFDAMVRTGVPTVMSVGACDMVNFGAMDSVPERFRRRNLHVHNPQVTLMRTTSDENRKIGEFIAAKVRGMKGPFRMLLPERGVSALDAEGKPFFDPEADAALFAAIEQGLPDHDVRRLPLHINDPEFAAEAVKAHHELMKKK